MITQDYIEGQSTSQVFKDVISTIISIISALVYVFILSIIYDVETFDSIVLNRICQIILTFYTYYRIDITRQKLLKVFNL